MIFNNKHNERAELKDGRIVWLSRSVAVVVTVYCVLNDQKYLLLGKRGPGCPDEVGKWNLPCGYLDWNETLKEAAQREVFEETGVNIRDLKESDIVVDYMDYPWHISSEVRADNSSKQNVSHHYAIIFKANTLPKLDNSNCEPGEIEELRWTKINEISDLDFAFNHDQRIKEFIQLEKL